jgi:hypothetical protein
MLPQLEDAPETLSEIEKHNIEKYGKVSPRILSVFPGQSSEDMRKRFPRTCEHIDPDIWVNGIRHGDIKVLKSVVRRPLNS